MGIDYKRPFGIIFYRMVNILLHFFIASLNFLGLFCFLLHALWGSLWMQHSAVLTSKHFKQYLCAQEVLFFQWSGFILLLIPCLILFYHSNVSLWIFKKYLLRNASVFIPCWWKNPCIKQMSLLLTLLQSTESQ